MRARARAEDGYSIVELLVVMTMLAFVMGGVLSLGSAAQKLGVRGSEESSAIEDAKVAAYRMTRELRQATKIMPTAATAGSCASTATASCIDFVVRTQSFATSSTTGYVDTADRNNHLVRRVRYDCTRPYTGPSGTGTERFRSCERFEGTAVVDSTATPPAATTSTGIIVPRLLNWATGTCATVDATFTCPVFTYRKYDGTAALASTNTTSSNAEQVNVALQIPAAGEGRGLGATHSLLVRDGAQLRNVLR